MNYRTKLDMLELTGINHHRSISNYLLEQICKIYSPNTASILVYGDKDLLISYLLSQKFLIHVIDTGLEEPRNTHRIKQVTTNTFPMNEYDVFILLSCDNKYDEDFVERYITKNSKYFILPNISHINWVRETLKYKQVPFNELQLDVNISNNIVFTNF